MNFNCFWQLNRYNFWFVLGKNPKWFFLEVPDRSLRTRKKMHPKGPPWRRNGNLETWKFSPLWRLLFKKLKKTRSSLLHLSNVSAKIYLFEKFDIYWSTNVKITGRWSCSFGSLDQVDDNLITDKVKQL